MKHSRHSRMLFTQPLNHVVYRVPPMLNTACVYQAPVVVVFPPTLHSGGKICWIVLPLCSAYSNLDLWNYKCRFCTDRLSVWPAQGKSNLSRSFLYCLRAMCTFTQKSWLTASYCLPFNRFWFYDQVHRPHLYGTYQLYHVPSLYVHHRSQACGL